MPRRLWKKMNRLPRPCKKCNKKFIPKGKFTKLCITCYDKAYNSKAKACGYRKDEIASLVMRLHQLNRRKDTNAKDKLG